MPDMTGFEVLDVLKNAPDLRHIPVVIVTSRTLKGTDVEILSSMSAGVLAKGGLKEGPVAEAVYRNLKSVRLPAGDLK
jgi:CheY-like chemotaxis protein